MLDTIKNHADSFLAMFGIQQDYFLYIYLGVMLVVMTTVKTFHNSGRVAVFYSYFEVLLTFALGLILVLSVYYEGIAQESAVLIFEVWLGIWWLITMYTNGIVAGTILFPFKLFICIIALALFVIFIFIAVLVLMKYEDKSKRYHGSVKSNIYNQGVKYGYSVSFLGLLCGFGFITLYCLHADLSLPGKSPYLESIAIDKELEEIIKKTLQSYDDFDDDDIEDHQQSKRQEVSEALDSVQTTRDVDSIEQISVEIQRENNSVEVTENSGAEAQEVEDSDSTSELNEDHENTSTMVKGIRLTKRHNFYRDPEKYASVFELERELINRE